MKRLIALALAVLAAVILAAPVMANHTNIRPSFHRAIAVDTFPGGLIVAEQEGKIFRTDADGQNKTLLLDLTSTTRASAPGSGELGLVGLATHPS